MAVIISPKIAAKLSAKHDVGTKDVHECLANRCSPEIEETRASHATDPPTMWFIARNDKGRILKIVLVHRHGHIFIKTAYEPGNDELNLFRQQGGIID